ncbi:hypothetical protein V496_00096 [Pseudogymnoascus sp. VKM F-4515 (FW-2607)]|nr:hypothetical protein V496_00096 [Pseudogymnoascus sp. VKM F-4515 (FW-2607)]
MKSFDEYVQDGNRLETHDDVPSRIREAREEDTTSVAGLSTIPITITVLPAPSSQTSHLVSSQTGTQVLGVPSLPNSIHRHDISGFRDDAVMDYCAWQQEQVKEPAQKVEYQKACDVILKDGMSQELIRQDPSPQFLIDGGVKRGPSLHVVGDIDYWCKKVKRARIEFS